MVPLSCAESLLARMTSYPCARWLESFTPRWIPNNMASPVPIEKCAQGGRAKTKAKMTAVRNAQAVYQANRRAHRDSLTIPTGFRTLEHFFTSLQESIRWQYGNRRDLALHIGVNEKSIRRWIAGACTPGQNDLDRLAQWRGEQVLARKRKGYQQR